jgi:hypothetical protein
MGTNEISSPKRRADGVPLLRSLTGNKWAINTNTLIGSVPHPETKQINCSIANFGGLEGNIWGADVEYFVFSLVQ